MKIFILEDDGNCSGVIEWLKNRSDEIKLVKNLEDACYFLEYEAGYTAYDKFIMDASLPGAKILHCNGKEKKYMGALNGIDYIFNTFPDLGIELKKEKVAILTAFAPQAKTYMQLNNYKDTVQIINKNDNHFKTVLQDFLES